MKIRRFLSVFLLTLLLTGLFCVPQASAVDLPQVNAKAALLMDYESGRMLYGLNERDTEYPASITKVMTALLTLEAVDQGVLTLDQQVAAPSLVNDMDPTGSSADIKEGEVLTVEQLLYCMMLVSANEAACILAETVAGSQDAFVALMNQRAQELGCTGTHFVNPNGLHDPNHYSTAWDIYLFTREAMKNETFMKICSTASYVVPATNMSEERELYTTNSLISNWRIMGYQYDGADGIKTGSTEESGYCLVSTAKRSGRRLVAVVLGCKGNGATVESFSESAKLYNWAYNNFSMRQVAATDELYRQPVALSKQTDTVMLYPAQSVEAFLPKDAKDEDIRKSVTLKEDVVNAPVTAGQELGTLTITYNDQVCAEVPLLAQADVSASRFLVAKAAVEAFFAKTWVKLALVAVVFVIIMTNAERRITIQYAKRVVGRKQMGGQNSYLPLKLNMSGVMPIIFASALVSIPGTIGSFLQIDQQAHPVWYAFFHTFNYTSWLYVVIYLLLILAFNYFYVAIQYNPVEIANNLRRNNGSIPGFRPGKPTSDFITRTLNKITLIGAIFLAAVAVLPIILGNLTGMSIQLGGTSLLIVVGVALDTTRSLDSFMTMRNHKGFLG